MFDDNAGQASPAVFGAEYAGMEEDEGPGTVYIATQRVGAQDTEARVELRQDEAERHVMLAYSSLESLVTCAGKAQAWIAVPTDRVSQVQEDCGAGLVLWDLELSADARHAASDEEGD